MIEVELIEGSYRVYREVCDKGELLPTIAAMLQKYEAEKGDILYRQNYAITFRVFK